MTTAAANEADEAAETAAARRKTGQRLVWTAIVARRRTILFALSGASVYLSVVLATPLVARQAVDTLVVDGEEDRLGFFVALLLGLGVVRAVSGAMRKYQATKGPALIANDLRRRLYEHFQWMSFSFHDRMGAGQLMARASTDVTALETALGPLPWTIQSVAMFVCGVIVLAFVQPLLAAVVAVVVGAGIAYGLWRARALYPASLALQEALGDWSGFVEQQVQGRARREGTRVRGAVLGAGRGAMPRRSRSPASSSPGRARRSTPPCSPARAAPCSSSSGSAAGSARPAA